MDEAVNPTAHVFGVEKLYLNKMIIVVPHNTIVIGSMMTIVC